MSREVLALRGKTLPDSHPIVAATLIVLGNALTDAGRPAAGEVELRESLLLRRNSLPPGHWMIASAENTLGACLTAQRRVSEAEPILLSSYELLASQLGNEHPVTVSAIERLVDLYEAWNRPEAAVRYRELLPATS